jgi:hypothetical protein
MDIDATYGEIHYDDHLIDQISKYADQLMREAKPSKTQKPSLKMPYPQSK